jgi:type 2 lantibiotic biosynthesis protein LanM
VLVGGVDLYNGQAGIALFLAYLGEITQEARYTDVARVALSTIQRQIATFPEQLSLPGAFYGWGAILHLYTHLGELWGEQALFKEAQQLVERFATEEVKDEAFNLLTGAAGGILSLLNLYRVAPTDCILQTAVKYGDHLLAHAVSLSPGCGWIEARLTRPLTGLARGAGGIALSLFALADASGEERFRQAALDALAYERGTFSSQEQNWPDMRAEETEYMTAWCQGAPGIALARLATLPYHDDATVREEIAVALQTTLTRGFGYNHSLCHGDLGNLEAFLCASMALVHSGYQAEVERLTALVLEDIEQNGWRTGTPQSVETPGMMVGIAGIGYELLRLSSPERVPSILSLAAPHVSQPTSFLQEETLQ